MNKFEYMMSMVVSIAANIFLFILLLAVSGTFRNQVAELMYENDVIFSAYEDAMRKITILEEEKSTYAYAGEIYNIEPELLEAIERLETGHFTSENYKNLMNTWGAYDSKKEEFISFDNYEQSTLELARTLRFNYFDKGLDTIEKISVVYCPSSIEHPNNSEHWAQQVRSIYEALKGE